jgi:CyaY protein
MSPMMDESQYLRRVDAVFRCIQDGCDAIDPDLVEAYVAGDVLTLTFADRSRCVVNTQRPTRQVWLAAGTRAWHFSLEADSGRWMDDKSRGDELYATLAAIVRDKAGVEVRFTPAVSGDPLG